MKVYEGLDILEGLGGVFLMTGYALTPWGHLFIEMMLPSGIPKSLNVVSD